jgi:hypothetical protein
MQIAFDHDAFIIAWFLSVDGSQRLSALVKRPIHVIFAGGSCARSCSISASAI